MTEDAQPEFRGNRVRNAAALSEWHERASTEAVVEPNFPILDAHHHLYGSSSDPHHYLIGQLREDLAGGHNILGTVYVEAYHSAWRTSGPARMRPVGEIEFIAGLTRRPLRTNAGDCQVAAGIVGYVDLTLGDVAGDVVAAEVEAAEGRMRGVRHMSAYNDGAVGKTMADMPMKNLLADSTFRRGVAQLRPFDLSLDVWGYHYQLTELIDLADAFPDISMVLNHVGGVIGVADFKFRRGDVRDQWAKDMHELSKRSNVVVKVGGLGMPLFGFDFERQLGPANSAELAKAWQPFVDTCVETFGPKRCLFESNFPVDKQSTGYTELWNAFKLVTKEFSSDERREMFYRTACRVYRLPELERRGDQVIVA